MPRTAPVPSGAQTRLDILAQAVQVAALEGLEALTIGRLATALEMSKAGLFAHFGSKEALQVATVEAAYGQFEAEVLGPAREAAPGVSRLRRMIGAYFDYLKKRANRGGCFFTAAVMEFDDRPGKVLDRLRALEAERQALLVRAVREAVQTGELDASADLEGVVFESMALCSGAVVAFQLRRDPKLLARAQATLERWLEAARPQGKAATRSAGRHNRRAV